MIESQSASSELYAIVIGDGETPAETGQVRFSIENLPLESLRPSPENDKLYKPVNPEDPEIIKLAARMRANGWLKGSVLVVTKDGYIISGHRRYVAAKLAGLTHVPCHVLSITREHPDCLRLLAEHNLQRVKTREEMFREEIVSVNPEEAYQEQLLRRSLNSAQRMHYVNRLAPIMAAEGIEKRTNFLKKGTENSMFTGGVPKGANLHLTGENTIEKKAILADVSPRTFKSFDLIQKSGSEKLKAKVLSGEIAVDAIKVALTKEQVKEYDLPPIMQAKPKSSRTPNFTRKFGGDVFELEAIHPAELQKILRKAIDSVLDIEAFNAELEAEKKDAAFLASKRRRIFETLQAEAFQ